MIWLVVRLQFYTLYSPAITVDDTSFSKSMNMNQTLSSAHLVDLTQEQVLGISQTPRLGPEAAVLGRVRDKLPIVPKIKS